ncbi:MAG TPA: glycosyltransferase family 39 protein, partial [Vicinamibacteria bacterium]
MADPARDPADRWIVPLLGLAGFGVFALYYLGLLGGRPAYWPDTYEYALAARALAETGKLLTDAPSVLEVWLLYRGTLPIPYFFHDVGNSLLLAASFRAFGSTDFVIPLASGLCFSLLPPTVFSLARRLFDRRAALLAAALACGSPQMITLSATGLSEVPAALGLTAVVALLLVRPGRMRSTVMSGAALGALVLLRSNLASCLPWFGAYVWADAGVDEVKSSRRRWVRVSAFLLGFAAISFPSMLRSYTGVGRPLFTVASLYMPLFSTPAIDGESKSLFSRPGPPVDPLAYFMGRPWEMARKAGLQFEGVIRELTHGGAGMRDGYALPILLFLFLLSGLAPPPAETTRQRRLRRLTYALMATVFAVGPLFQMRLRYLYPFLPLV